MLAKWRGKSFDAAFPIVIAPQSPILSRLASLSRLRAPKKPFHKPFAAFRPAVQVSPVCRTNYDTVWSFLAVCVCLG